MPSLGERDYSQDIMATATVPVLLAHESVSAPHGTSVVYDHEETPAPLLAMAPTMPPSMGPPDRVNVAVPPVTVAVTALSSRRPSVGNDTEPVEALREEPPRAESE